MSVLKKITNVFDSGIMRLVLFWSILISIPYALAFITSAFVVIFSENNEQAEVPETETRQGINMYEAGIEAEHMFYEEIRRNRDYGAGVR